jgi:hypothetical protein
VKTNSNPMTSQPARRWRPSGLWANSDFVKLWTRQTVSKFGTHITGARAENNQRTSDAYTHERR